MSEMKRSIEVGYCPLRAILVPCSNCTKTDPIEIAECSAKQSLSYSHALLKIADDCYQQQLKLAHSVNRL